MKIVSLLFFCLLWLQPLQSEPWLSNRFAQNCAGCHAPGRINRVPKERRCTLSCQGCHTNPNGGGMRNHYGKWTAERWLRSHYIPGAKTNQPTPAPYQKQVYAPLLEAQKLSSPRHKKIASKYTKKQAAAILKKNEKKILDPEQGLPLVPISRWKVDEKDYDKYNDTRWQLNNTNPVIDLASATRGDPLRQKQYDWFRAGFDARMFYIDAKYENTSQEDFAGFSWMNMDLAVELKPFAPNYKFVFETRYGNSPRNSQWDTLFNDVTGSRSFTRSAYLLVDDLAYNTYMLYGIFRPLFGLFDPNHLGLAQRINGMGYDGTVKGVSLGAAPNVPFANVHFITPRAGALNRESGAAVNLGARFVTLSASAVFSYWDTRIEGSSEFNRKMWSMHLGGMVKKLIINTELMRYDRITETDRNGGTVTTLDLRYPVYKDHYLQLNYAVSNVAPDLSPGEAQETLVGYKMFLLSGVELEFLFKNQEDRKVGFDPVNVSYLQSQLHLYF